MTYRTSRVAILVLASLVLGGCTATADTDTASSPAGGTIELAISRTCNEGSDSRCLPVGDEHVMRPSGYDEAAVEKAVVSGDKQQNAVHITFTDDGAEVLTDLTTRAADAGSESRLLLKIGGEIRAAVRVEEPLSGERVTIGLAPEDDPQEVVELIRGT